MALAPEDVVNKRFTITKFRDGYDLDQVDDFLDTIVEELRLHEQEKNALQAEIDDLKAQLAGRETPEAAEVAEAPVEAAAATVVEEDTVVVSSTPQPMTLTAAGPSFSDGDALKSSAMLQLALELHDKHVLEGETRRDQLIRDGESTAHRLVEEAQKTRADELNLLSTERVDLQDKIKDLREFESEYRSTLRSYIQAQLRGLDGSPEPAGDPSALR